MLRHLYRGVLHLHPPGFQRRFSDEMLSIFDQTPGTLPAFRLLLDAAISLARQWTLRPEFWHEIPRQAQPVADGVPAFSSLDPFRPRTSAIVHGIVLSMVLFCATCVAIRYSWIHVLHVHIPEIALEAPSVVRPAASHIALPGMAGSPRDQKATAPDSRTLQLYVEPVPVEADNAQPNVKSRGERLSAASLPGTLVTSGGKIDLQAYRGTYLSHSPEVVISISIDGGRLVMHVSGEKHTLSPLSERTFLTEDGEVEFGAESDGKFYRLQLSLSGQQIIAERR